MRDKTRALSQESYGLLLLLLSAVLYSFAGVLVKLAANTGLSSSELVLLRAIFQGSIVVTSMCLYKTDDGVRLICQPFGNSCSCHQDCHNSRDNWWSWLLSLLLYHFGTAIGRCHGSSRTETRSSNIFRTNLARRSHYTIACCRHYYKCRGIDTHCATILSISKYTRIPASIGHVTGILGACCAAGVVTLIRKAGSIGAHTLQLLFSWAFFGILFSTISLFIHFIQAAANDMVVDIRDWHECDWIHGTLFVELRRTIGTRQFEFA